jgi:hypothetical protein
MPRIPKLLIAVITLLTLVTIGLAFLHRLEDKTQAIFFASHLLYQHLCGWIICFFGIAFVGWHTFNKTNQLPYEILNGKKLFRMMFLLLFLNVAYFINTQPFPSGYDKIVPVMQFVITITTIIIAWLLALAALLKKASPRLLLIVLIMYQLYFTIGVFSYSLLERGLYASSENLWLIFTSSPLVWLASGAIFSVAFGLETLRRRNSPLDELLDRLNGLDKTKSKVKKQEDDIKQIQFTDDLTNALRILSKVVNPPNKPSSEDRIKELVADLLDQTVKKLDERDAQTTPAAESGDSEDTRGKKSIVPK